MKDKGNVDTYVFISEAYQPSFTSCYMSCLSGLTILDVFTGTLQSHGLKEKTHSWLLVSTPLVSVLNWPNSLTRQGLNSKCWNSIIFL